MSDVSLINAFNSNSIPEYMLMNKDKEIASFAINDVLSSIDVIKQNEKLPVWISDIGAFIRNRRAPKHRENIAELLRQSGCDTLRGFIDITHALSLVDTFWVRPIDSRLTWESVSLYTHPFNEVVAKTAFEGGLHGRGLSTTSPEYGTDGSFAKCWIRERDKIRMLKRGSSGAANAGMEPYSEYYAAQIIKEFTDEFVSYDLRTVGGRICSVCDIFTSEDFGYLPFDSVSTRHTDVVEVLNKAKKYGLESKFRRMFVIDAVIMNEDRHKNNFGFLVDNDAQVIVDMAPLFDHNVSLLPYAMEDDFQNIKKYLRYKGPRIGDHWTPIAAVCLDDSLRRKLINLLDFKFTRHNKYNLPEWRLEALEKLVHNNIERILQFKV
ncbi:MAG: HipA protein [Eubacterium sp.]|nr:HipA protein [Eubacterium sp.]